MLSRGRGCLWNIRGSSLPWISSFKFCWSLDCIAIRDIICLSPWIRVCRWNFNSFFLKPRDSLRNHKLWMKRSKHLVAISPPDYMFVTHMNDKVVFPECRLVSVLIWGAHWAGQRNICARSSIWWLLRPLHRPCFGSDMGNLTQVGSVLLILLLN